jgi:hypothetical protein
VTGLSETSGSAGSTITITGQNFSGAAGHLSVLFGSTAASSVTYVSDSQITAIVPNGVGTVNVTVQSGVNETDNISSNPNANVNEPIFGYGVSAVTTADEFTYSGQTISPTNSTVSFASPTVAVGSTDVITIVVKDNNGNPITGLGSSAFRFALSGGKSAGKFGSVSATSTPGTYTVVFTGTKAGTASRLTATVRGVRLNTKPKVLVVAGAVTGANSAISFGIPTAESDVGDWMTPSDNPSFPRAWRKGRN